MASTGPRTRAQIAERLGQASGALGSAALARMERDLPWVAELPAEDRSWIGLIVQAGISSFVDWYRHTSNADAPGPLADTEAGAHVSAEVFGVAPRKLTGEISFEQTVALVRLSISSVDESLDGVFDEDEVVDVRHVLNGYARELAFATAEVYARAAEQRGAWDARLEALVVDGVMRGDAGATLLSRASALGWVGRGHVVVIVGAMRDDASIDHVRRCGREHSLDCLCAVHGDRLVVVLGGVGALGEPPADLVDGFGPGAVVVGPVVGGLGDASRSAHAALAGLRAARGWADAPRPVASDDVLPERILDGDPLAREQLLAEVFAPLEASGVAVRDTVAAYVDGGSSIEATARRLYVHANTVRYRLRRAQEATGLSPTDPREAFTLRLAITLGRLSQPTESDQL